MPYPLQFRTIVRYGLILLVVALLLGYTLWQARFLIIGPTIVLTATPPTASEERVITLSGTASNIVRITLNGRQIFTDQQGNFSESVVLEHGLTTMTIAGVDRYGRTTEITHQTVYTPSE